jgi:hypothetical protein
MQACAWTNGAHVARGESLCLQIMMNILTGMSNAG